MYEKTDLAYITNSKISLFKKTFALTLDFHNNRYQTRSPKAEEDAYETPAPVDTSPTYDTIVRSNGNMNNIIVFHVCITLSIAYYYKFL